MSEPNDLQTPNKQAPPNLIEQYEEECERLAAEEEDFLSDTVSSLDNDSDDPPDTNFIEQCLMNNERGDGILYARFQRNKFVHVKKREKRPWLMWNGHHWEIDVMGHHIRSVEQVACAYRDEAFALDEPIRKASSDLREAEAKVTMAKDSADLDAQIKAEADVRSHTHTLKLLRSKKEKYLRRVDRLRGKGGAEKTTWWSHHVERSLAIDGREIDQLPMVLAAPNGVIDLYSGELREGRPQDYLLRRINVPYPTDIDKKRIMRYLDTGQGLHELEDWENFITQILSYDPDGKDDHSGVPQFLQRLAGYSYTGDVRYHILPICVGGGRNGKGTFFRTSQAIAGEFYHTLKSELLLDQKNPPSPGAASPHLIAMSGKRFCVASETDQHRHIAAARVKEYSGGDVLNARSLFGEEEDIYPTWKLWLQTNNIPTGVTKDFAMRQRIAIITFPWRYVPDVAMAAKKEPHLAPWFRTMDPDLEKRLTVKRSLILLWYLRGAILMQREGPNIPTQVRADLDEQQLKEDHLEQHLRTCCLQDWDPDREYNEGDEVNLPCPKGGTGLVFISDRNGNIGFPPGQNDQVWRYRGHGYDPQEYTFFKEYYGCYVKWFKENINDKDSKIPSPKGVSDALRKKGYQVEAKGGQTKIFNGGIKVLGGLTA